MKSIKLLVLAGAVALAGSAHAQYTAPRTDSTTYAGGASHAEWELDGGLGYLFAANLPDDDADGVMMHLGGYYIDPVNSTRETILKYGGEFIYGNASSRNTDLNTVFFAANVGAAYRFNRQFEAGIFGGVGLGAATLDNRNGDTSTALFGFQIRPEATFWATDKIGVSMSYRFFQSVALNDDWNRNPQEHALEFSVKYRF